MVGQAADFQLTGRPVTELQKYKNQLKLVQLLLELEKNNKFEFDQLIIEGVPEKYHGNNTKLYPKWIHISYLKGNNRTYGQTSRKPKLQYMYKDHYYSISPDDVLNIVIP